jgi:hypothetical protein
MTRQLVLDHDCQRLHLPAGAVLICHAGRLWLTQDTRAQQGASPDLVLQPGQRHRTTQAGDYIVTHLRPGPPARCEVILPAASRRTVWAGWRFSPRV